MFGITFQGDILPQEYDLSEDLKKFTNIFNLFENHIWNHPRWFYPLEYTLELKFRKNDHSFHTIETKIAPKSHDDYFVKLKDSESLEFRFYGKKIEEIQKIVYSLIPVF